MVISKNWRCMNDCLLLLTLALIGNDNLIQCWKLLFWEIIATQSNAHGIAMRFCSCFMFVWSNICVFSISVMSSMFCLFWSKPCPLQLFLLTWTHFGRSIQHDHDSSKVCIFHLIDLAGTWRPMWMLESDTKDHNITYLYQHVPKVAVWTLRDVVFRHPKHHPFNTPWKLWELGLLGTRKFAPWDTRFPNYVFLVNTQQNTKIKMLFSIFHVCY